MAKKKVKKPAGEKKMTLQSKKSKAFDMNIKIAMLQAELKKEAGLYQVLVNEIIAEESKQKPPIEE